MNAALVIAHPGHELRVHHWLEVARPVVCVLTDGSGHHGSSRIATTGRILNDAGAPAGPIYGSLTDRALYKALIHHDLALFQRLANALADALVDGDIDLVACDAIEGYNPAHDICRHVVDAARVRASLRSGRPIAGYDFLLVGRPDAEAPVADASPIRLRLDDAALDRKIAAARSYAELAAEVDAAIGTHGPEAFRTECLRPIGPVDLTAATGGQPYYEQHGARRVEGGQYAEVIRFADHLRPVAVALAAHGVPARP